MKQFEPKYKVIGQVPVFKWDVTEQRNEAIEIMKKEQPVVLKNFPLTPALKWNYEYLARHFPQNEHSTVSVYTSDQAQFLYNDEEKNVASYKFQSKTKKLELTWPQLRKWREEANSDNENWWYVQNSLKQDVGPQIVQDFKDLDWSALTYLQYALNMGPIQVNTLWIGKNGVITPLHFDEPFNFFLQVEGKKKFTLFSPANWVYLYPYPNAHACDRQSRVDILNPDLEKFPKVVNAQAQEAFLEKGDVLYIPPYFWHHVSSLTETISLNFWFNPSPNPPDPTFPLSESQIVAIRRNIEKMLGVAIGPGLIPQFLKELHEGRYDGLELRNPPVGYGNVELLNITRANALAKKNK